MKTVTTQGQMQEVARLLGIILRLTLRTTYLGLKELAQWAYKKIAKR